MEKRDVHKACIGVEVQVGDAVKWVLILDAEEVGVAVTGSRRQRDAALELYGYDMLLLAGPVSLPEFLEFAREHPVLRQIKNWEPLGLLH